MADRAWQDGPESCLGLMEAHLDKEDQLSDLVDDIVKSCGVEGSIDHLNASPIPTRESIAQIIELLEDVLFPGYFGKQELDRSVLQYHIGHEVTRLFELLFTEISKAYIHECKRFGMPCTACGCQARRQTIQFLRGIPRLRMQLAGDVRAAFKNDPAAKSIDEIVFSYPATKAITTYRVAHELHVQGVPLLPRMMTEMAHAATGIDIHPGATIGKNFFIDHGTGVVVGETTVIGDNVVIYQGVTLGALNIPRDSSGEVKRDSKRHPTIEDDVVIYSGATILGGDTVIGRGSVIGGNVWLTHSVPPNSRVVVETTGLRISERKPTKCPRPEAGLIPACEACPKADGEANRQ